MDSEILSPIPQQPIIAPKTLSFPEAIAQVIDGRRIARLEWRNLGGETDYGFLKDGLLQIFTNNKFNQWVVSESDMISEDWIVLADINVN